MNEAVCVLMHWLYCACGVLLDGVVVPLDWGVCNAENVIDRSGSRVV
jgi:hypothetical protein